MSCPPNANYLSWILIIWPLLFLCTVWVFMMLFCLFQKVCFLASYFAHFWNTNSDHSFSRWYAFVLLCILLVTQTVACLALVGELACFLMWTLLVTLWPVLFQFVSWPGFFCGLFWWHRLWPVLFQLVSWPGFNVQSSSDTDCGLACFRGLVGLVFNLHSSGDTLWPVLFQSVSLPDFYCALLC